MNILLSSYLQNNDIKNFYYLGLMIVTGILDKKFENINLPTLHKARWYTYLIRLFRLFLQTPNPSVKFRKMVRFGLWNLCLTIRVKMAPLIQGKINSRSKSYSNQLRRLYKISFMVKKLIFSELFISVI